MAGYFRDEDVPGRVQPQGRRPINPAHRLAGLLQHVWKGDDRAAISSRNLTATPHASAVLVAKPQGIAIANTSAANTASTTVPGVTRYPIVTLFYGYMNDNSANIYPGGLAGSFANFYISGGSATAVTGNLRYQGTQRSVAVTLPEAVGVPLCCILQARSETDYDLYANGIQSTHGTASPGTVTSALVSLLNPGSYANGGAFLCGYGWGGGAPLSDAEALQITANPQLLWDLYAPQTRRIWVPVSAGGDTTISGALGTATASGHAGTVNANRTIAGALGTASASGLQGTVNANTTIAGTLGTAVASGLSGTVSNTNDTVIGGALGIAIASGLIGTVNASTVISGNLGTAVASGLTGTVSNGTTTDLALILKILSNRQELNATTGKFTLYDDDGVTVLYESDAWEDTAGTIPYRGKALRRIDALA